MKILLEKMKKNFMLKIGGRITYQKFLDLKKKKKKKKKKKNGTDTFPQCACVDHAGGRDPFCKVEGPSR